MIGVTLWSCLSREVNSKSKAWAVVRANSAAFHSRGEWRVTVPWQSQSSKTTLWSMVWRCLDPCSERLGTVGAEKQQPGEQLGQPMGDCKEQGNGLSQLIAPCCSCLCLGRRFTPKEAVNIMSKFEMFFFLTFHTKSFSSLAGLFAFRFIPRYCRI